MNELKIPTLDGGPYEPYISPTPMPPVLAAINSPIFAFGLAAAFLISWAGFAILTIVGIFMWILFRKDQIKSAKGRKFALIGIIGFIITFLIFIAINVIMNAFGLLKITNLSL